MLFGVRSVLLSVVFVTNITQRDAEHEQWRAGDSHGLRVSK